MLTLAVTERPTGLYTRRLWYLYEWLTHRRLDLPDGPLCSYVPLLDSTLYYTSTPIRSRRHRVLDNLLGTRAFSPMVRRTDALRSFEDRRLADLAVSIVREFDADAISRAVTYLYTTATRSSFAIENERPTLNRIERFVALLRQVAVLPRLDRDELLRLQNATVDERFADADYREEQVYVGESVGLRQRVHYVAPKPEDVADMMGGLLTTLQRLEASTVDPVVAAAVVSFGFVIIHPFRDGNGRIHRFLLHYVLARMEFTPPGLIVPVSAVMNHRRQEYDAALEAFSRRVMSLVEYDLDADGVLAVRNETANLYRYFDATSVVEQLYAWIEETLRTEFREELEFVVRFRDAKQVVRAIVDMPDQKLNLFVSLCFQHHGTLGAARRRKHFDMLTDEEVRAMEEAIRRVSPVGRAGIPG
jgi:hypothetical protein